MSTIRHKTYRLFSGDPDTRREFKSQLKFLIIVTLGFTIAFSWRETTFDAVQTLILSFTEIENVTYASIATSTTITVISLLLILVTARLLQVRPEYR